MLTAAFRAWALGLLALALAGPPARAGGGPQNVLLLVNERSPESIEVGEHYARARGLHPLNVLRLRAPVDPEIPFDAYETAIAGPVALHLERTGLGPQIDYIVATQGFPLRLVLPKGSPQRNLSLTAALQGLGADLSALPATPAGRLNPYFGVHKAFAHAEALAGGKVRIRLTAMLAGFSAADAKGLVDRALQAEAAPPPKGLFLFQDARANAKARNETYDQAANLLGAEGLEARRIGPGAEALKEIPPLICWFSGGSYSGLTREAIRALSFRPGAIVDMLQSFGAVPANFVDDGKFQQVPIAWAVEAGATGVHGAVAEPYTAAFPDPGTALLYARGFNLAESFLGRIRTFWWQNLLLGDPLCAPFARRPEFACSLERLPPGPVGGRLEIAVEGEDLAGSELFLEGLRAARAGPGEPLVWETLAFPDGPLQARVVAFAGGPARVQAHRLLEVQVYNPSFRILGFEVEGRRSAAGPADALLLAFSRPPALPAAAGAVALLGPDGARPAFELLAGPSPRHLRLLPRAPLRASTTYSIAASEKLVDRHGRPLEVPFEAAFRTTAAGLALRGPEAVTAGGKARFELLALAGQGPDAPADEGYAGRVRIRPGDPAADDPGPVELAAGRGEAALLFRTAGEWVVELEDPDSGLKGSSRVRVEPGPFARVELIAPKEWPAGHALPATLVARDACGNETPSASPPLTVALGPGLPVTTVLGGTGRTTLLFHAPWTEGEAVLLVKQGEKEAGKAAVKLLAGPLRRWLRLGPFAPRPGARAEPPAPPRPFPEPGLVHEGEPWLPEEAKDSPAPLPWLGENRAGWLALPLLCLARENLEVRIGLAGLACGLYLDGRKLGQADATNAFLEDALRLKLPLTPGPRWLGLALSRPGPAAAALRIEIAAEKGGPPGLCLFPGHPLQPPERLTLSGRLRVGAHGLQGLKVELSGPSGKVQARTAENGFFAFPALAPGRYTIRPLAGKLAFKPPARDLALEEGHLWDQDFEAVDALPPTLKVLAPRPNTVEKKLLRVQVQADDDLGVAEIRFLIDGKQAGTPLHPPETRAELPVDQLPRGNHLLTVIAKDHAGNETKLDIPFK